MIITFIDPIVKLIGDWLAEINIWSICVRLLLAVFCGGLIGVERATKKHAAGFRTYILVCVGSAIAMLTNQFIFQQFGSGDASRLGAQVISGIGFLGAGTILVTSRNQIRGLTTAAGLWACACLGLAIGIGFYTLAIASLVLIVLALTFFTYFEDFFNNRSKTMQLHLELDTRTNLKDFVHYIRENKMKIYSIEHNPAYSSSGLSVYTVSIELDKKDKKEHKHIINEIAKLEYVNYVEEMN